MPEPGPQHFRNTGLFKDHYLTNRLAEMPEPWRPSEDEMKAAYNGIWRALAEFRATWTRKPPNEAQTENDLIVPVLDALGFEYIPQTDAKRQGQRNWPDYTLFPDLSAKKRAARHAGNNRLFYERALAVVEAERWGRRLDSADRNDPDRRYENPSQQIIRYLGAVHPHGPVWGLLTDGKRWRLYNQRVEDRTAQFYEVDLESVCTGNYDTDREAFRYFYYFLRRDAFVPSPHLNQTFLGWVLEQSQAHSQKLEQDLRSRIFERIFLYLAKGFIYYRRHELGLAGPENQEELAEVFGGTLTLLYRLLFLLHAEDRHLLPVMERGTYYEKSLTQLKFAVAQRAAATPEPRGERAYELWERLRTLFSAIASGRADWNVPRYNGGLFSDKGRYNTFLSRHKVPDDYLTAALYHLCSDENTATSQVDFLDYADLDVRQLGSIYEGLLEFHLEWADRDLVVVKDGHRYLYRAAADVSPATPNRRGARTYGAVTQGDLYLVNDRRERRATGAVFTPAYIVSHIVRKTVGPALEERLAQAGTLLEQRSRGYEAAVLESVLGLRILDPAMGSGHFLVSSLDYLSNRLAEWLATQPADNPLTALVESIREAVLESLRAQHLSDDFVSSAEEKLTDNNLLKRLLMKKCVYGVDYNEMAVELAKLSLWLNSFTVGAPLSFLDHHLRCGNSLVGSDWETLLANFSQAERGKGKRRRVQMTLDAWFFAPLLDAARHMDEVANLTDSSFTEVEKSADLYEQYYAETSPFRRMLDLWTSQHFGNRVSRDHLRVWGPAYAAYLTGGEAAYRAARTRIGTLVKAGSDGRVAIMDTEEQGLALTEVRRRVGLADELAATPWLRFFHWELEFPEVYFRADQRIPDAGFDVVLGNPPYIKYQNRDDSPEFKAWYSNNYLSAHGNYDVYILFVERALDLLRPGGRHGYIVYNKWLVSEYGRNLRGILAKARAVSEIVDFTDNQVFPEHTTYTCLLFMVRNERTSVRYTRIPLLGNEQGVARMLPLVLHRTASARTRTLGGTDDTSTITAASTRLEPAGPVFSDEFAYTELSDQPWSFVFGADRPLLRKVAKQGRPLLAVTRDGDGICVGVQTSADSIFITSLVRKVSDDVVRVHSSESDAALNMERGLLRSIVSGEDIDRYAFRCTRKLILFPYRVDGKGAHLLPAARLERYPRTWRYLQSFEDDLRSRESDDDGDGSTRRARPFDDDEWYRFGRSQNIDKQHLPKLCVAQTVTKLEVALDLNGEFCTHNVRVNSIILPQNATAEDHYYLLALLNSRLLDWCFKTGPVGRHAQGHYAANRQFIKDLPIYVPKDHTPEERKCAALEEFTKRRSSAKSDPELADLIAWCDSAFLLGRRRADDVARDVLVWLAQRMERGTRKRQEERDGFLSYLSKELGADLATLSGRSDLAKYDEIPPERIMEILRSPANVAQYNAAGQRGMAERSRPLREAIEREHAKSARKLQRRSAMLDRNQQLIDHIVYRLYGLTDDEIAIVEGKAVS